MFYGTRNFILAGILFHFVSYHPACILFYNECYLQVAFYYLSGILLPNKHFITKKKYHYWIHILSYTINIISLSISSLLTILFLSGILSPLLPSDHFIKNWASDHLFCILFTRHIIIYKIYYYYWTYYQLQGILLPTRYFFNYCVFYLNRHIILSSISLSNIYFILLSNMYFIPPGMSWLTEHLNIYRAYYSMEYIISTKYSIYYLA